jgi:hypothetical protein
MFRTSCRSSISLLATLAVLTAGCGEKSSESVAECRGEAANKAAARVVARYFAQGKLGTRAQAQRELGPNGSSFFDGDGELRPYVELTPRQQAAFNHWMYQTPRVFGPTHRAQEQAKQAALERAKDDCG